SAAIECLNRHSGRIFETRDTYLASVDPATGAARADRPPVLPGLYGLDPCRRLVKEAGAMTPAIADLDGASAAYVAALEGLDTAYGALAAYYKKGENLDDKGAKAATLHPAAMAAFDAFAVAHRGLDGVVREMNRKRRVDDLAAREKAVGRKLEVIIDSMMLEAETLIAMVTAADGVDPAAVAAQAEAYGKLVDETDAYAGAHADEAAERGSITNLKNYSKTFLAAAKVVSRKLTAKEAPTDDDRAAAVEQYNALVDNYNHH
ncbi:MAG: DUF3829 domain-containing protein, partial [Myxococcales bacterium]|nr:DUF3829 domain-containing protein [Myxococcales bacterium]